MTDFVTSSYFYVQTVIFSWLKLMSTNLYFHFLIIFYVDFICIYIIHIFLCVRRIQYFFELMFCTLFNHFLSELLGYFKFFSLINTAALRNV